MFSRLASHFISPALLLFTTIDVYAETPKDISLSNLIAYDKATCLKGLEQAELTKLWDVFLEGQATIGFISDLSWLEKQAW